MPADDATLTGLLARPALRAAVDRMVPADDFPSGWDAGVGDFLARILRTELPHAVELLTAGLDLLDAEADARAESRSGDGGGTTGFAALADTGRDEVLDALRAGQTTADWSGVDRSEFLRLMESLAVQGFYADPDNGGNRDGVSWRMVGYRAAPQDAEWPAPEALTVKLPLTPFGDLEPHYDAIVVGAGAGGGTAACVLAEAGYRVLAVERGDFLRTEDLRGDHLRSHRALFGYAQSAGPVASGHPRVWAPDGDEEVVVGPTDGRWSNNAMTVGGGTRVFGAQAWRFVPEDFRMASVYGVPDGSSLADWPLSYDDLEPYYDRAEWELGVAGDPAGFTGAGPRRRGLPMPPLPGNLSGARLAAGARDLGWSTGHVPLLINSTPYGGRPACVRCGQCVGFGCPAEAKNGSHNTVLPRALATGRCDLVTGTFAERVVTDDSGRVTGVALATLAGGSGPADGEVRRRTLTADQVILAAGAIETARLLLNSASATEPTGLGNRHDQVGRNLQGHVYAGALGIFDDVVQNSAGPGPTIATHDFRHHNDGLVGGGMLANDFVPMPLATYNLLTGAGVIPRSGAASKRGMRELYQRTTMVMGPLQETPNPRSRVTVDPRVRDVFGMPVARLSGGVLDLDRPTAAMLQRRAAEWLAASGATRTVPSGGVGRGPSGGQHQAGTCRMGTDPATSVTDPKGRVWGHDNLRLADGSLHVTNGGVNPVLTIFAMAFRVADLLAKKG
ncbi:GMC family oxidoreductase [Actinopolymorpha singaporensis]|uniref:Choline dehydrogenase n=1 Tax=Actinopolymorpha singaporensis TaxID=117157 RepID=A0A1H1QGR7_9ACTN|nr:GMC family oxidoreductase [Actinopolymorpha singaporensis]SDS22497.1 Choline dehydrogenase [Actinopolymorpha singaporensis]